MSVTAVGSIALDSLILPSGNHNNILGGSASHFCTSCALYDTSVNIVGVVGKDFPQEHIDHFKNRQVNTEDLQIENGKTFRWSGEYKIDEMDQAITHDTQLNVFESFHPVLSQESSKPRFLFLGNIHPGLQREVAQKANADLIIMDTMNLWIQNTRDQLIEAIKEIDVLIFNETEARDLTGKDRLIDAARVIQEIGPRVVVIKKGGEGAMLVNEDDLFLCPSFPVKEVVDPTGAGDSFAGGFVGYLAEQNSLTKEHFRRAVVHGNVMGSLNVEGVGLTVLSTGSRKLIENRYNEYRKLTSF